jgi:hypothetical protein
MPTQTNTARPFDLDAGESALKQLEAELRALPQSELLLINADPQDCAMAALALCDVARDPARLARLRELPASILAADIIEQLELTAWAMWYAHVKLQTETAQAQRARVDAETYEASGKHLQKMLKLIEYHVGHVPEVAAELAGIRSGIGYQDRASDLVRAASLFDIHRSELAGDTRHYHEDDGKVARRHAETILESIRASMGKSAAEWSDLRTRAWSRLTRQYNELKSAGEFVFRDQPEQRDLFVALRQVVVPRRGRAREQEAPSNGGAADGVTAVLSDN